VDSDGKLKQLAEVVVQKYGDDALAVVSARIEGRLSVQDYNLAALWSLVAAIIHARMGAAKPQRGIHEDVREIAAGIVMTLAREEPQADLDLP
jgi:hypothetical protein